MKQPSVALHVVIHLTCALAFYLLAIALRIAKMADIPRSTPRLRHRQDHSPAGDEDGRSVGVNRVAATRSPPGPDPP